MPNVAEIHITWDDAGVVAVNGPVENIVIFNGLLEAAKEAGATMRQSLAKRLIQPASGLLAPSFDVKGRKG